MGPRLLTSAARPIGLATACLAGMPVLVDLLLGDRARKFSMTASDTFYYLTVARHAVTGGGLSFDGERLTNGFHPLWQLVSCVVMGATSILRMDSASALDVLLVLGAALTGLAAYLGARACADGDGDVSPFAMLLPLGFGTLVYTPLSVRVWGSVGRPSASLWGCINGMETSLTIAAYAALLFIGTRWAHRERYALLLGSALGALSLARLDHAIFSATLGLGLIAFGGRESRRAHLAAAGIWAAVLGVYVGTNLLVFHVPVPISGALKSTFPGFTNSNEHLFIQMWSTPGRLGTTHAQRGLQLAIPAVVAALHLLAAGVALALGWRPAIIDRLLLLSAPAVLGLAAYDFLFVPKLNQGFWYFPVSFFYVSLVGLRGCGPIARRITRPSARWALAASLALASVASYSVLLAPLRRSSPRAAFYYEEAPKLRAFYRGRPPKIVEYDDGIITFSTGFPAMSGMGLTLDVDAVAAAGGIGAHRTGKNTILDLGISRGFTRFCTLSYAGGGALSVKSTDREIRRAYYPLIGHQARGYHLEVEYADGPFSIIVARSRP